MQLRIKAVAGEQVIVRALFDYAAIVDDKDGVRHAHGGQSVRDNQHRALAADGAHVVLDDALGFIIQRAGRFVENQDARVGD